ncbi:MAG TPA: hypothetical protein VK858_04665 [Longimicrobiales bacterium]|nr:hypothetical protein [Longimicrobiales bacterium]
MHLLLTDRLVCPRCGPGFGLILRADRLDDRRVIRGGLGCPNCREVYPVAEAVADLRPPPRADHPTGADPVLPDDEETLRAQALLGITAGPGHVLLVGRAARFASGLASRVPDLEVVAAGPVPSAPSAGPPGEEAGVQGWSRVHLGETLPFDSRSLGGVLLDGDATVRRLREAARVVTAGGRVVILDAPEGAAGTLMAAGLTVRLDESGVVVAGR